VQVPPESYRNLSFRAALEVRETPFDGVRKERTHKKYLLSQASLSLLAPDGDLDES
jgi:hypothetical protein